MHCLIPEQHWALHCGDLKPGKDNLDIFIAELSSSMVENSTFNPAYLLGGITTPSTRHFPGWLFPAGDKPSHHPPQQTLYSKVRKPVP